MSIFGFSLHASSVPLSAVQIGRDAVSGATFERRGGRLVVAAHAVETLPDQAVQPGLTNANLLDRDAVLAAARRVLESIGRPRRVGLVLADPVAKVSLVKLQQVPTRAADLEQVVRWQVRKAAPFPVEEAQVSFMTARRSDEGQEFLVALARRDVVVEYETVCLDAGAHPGIVDLSTMNVLNAAMAAGAASSGDWLLVNVARDWASIAVLRGGDLVFFRTRGADVDGTLEDLVHQTAMYYEDRLQGTGLRRAMLCAPADEGAEVLARSLADRLQVPVEAVDLAGVVGPVDPVVAGRPAVDTLAPLAGMVLRDQEAAA